MDVQRNSSNCHSNQENRLLSETVVRSPSYETNWVCSTEEAIQLLEKRITERRNEEGGGTPSSNLNERRCTSFTCRHRSEGEISHGPYKGSSSFRHFTPSRTAERPIHLPSLGLPNEIKPILKKHKRCSSLGQAIRYIDETPPPPITPHTCPSTPNPLGLPSSCNCSCYGCKTTGTPKSVALSFSFPEDSLEHCNNRDHQAFFCSNCRCVNSDFDSLQVGLVPPLASAEQLSMLDNHGIAGESSHHPENSDRLSLYSIHMQKDFRYYFQHPYARIFISYFVIFCNFLIFAEDPISHSHTECEIPVVGNVISFISTRYPPEWYWTTVKVIFWVSAIIVGLVVGKYIFHHMLLRRMLRLKMFRDEQGTWMIMWISIFISCYIFSVVYNCLLISIHPNPNPYIINTRMGVSNANFMKAAACGTWLGDFFTAWMVTDMMLQDNLYPGWAKGLRKFWHNHGSVRIIIFWTGSIGMSALVIYLIVSDDISWDNLNNDFISSTELSRAFLASSILVMDLLVVMQDWDFPHFVCDLDIKLPGLKQASYTLKFFKKSINSPDLVFHITGKWFNYAIIVVVMMLDLNMVKNQFIYNPPDYGQYVGPDNKVYSVSDKDLLALGNSSLWTFSRRASTINQATNKTYAETDLKVNSRYLGYPTWMKSIAFLPCAAGFALFFTLIYQYGRFPPKTDASYGGRLKKRTSSSSWRRERRSSHGGYISWRGITIYTGNPMFNLKRSHHNSSV